MTPSIPTKSKEARKGLIKKVPAKSGVRQTFLFINDTQANGQVNKQSHSGIRSHAMAVVRQRQRVQDAIEHAKTHGSELVEGNIIPMYTNNSERLNDNAFAIGISALAREHWRTVERHFATIVPPIWEQISLRQITRSSSLGNASIFEVLFKDELGSRRQVCFQDPLHMHATICLGLACSTWVMKSNLDTTLPDIFMNSALLALQKRVRSKTPFDEHFVMSINCLCNAEIWRGDIQAALAHMRIIRHLYAELDGLRTFTPLRSDMVLLTDRHIALRLFQPPVLPLEFDPGPTVWPSLWHRTNHPIGIEKAFNTMATAFMGESTRNLLGAGLSKIIRDNRDCILVALDVQLFSGPESVEAAYARWFYLRSTAIVYRLLSLPQDASTPRGRSRLGVQIGLISWISMITADYTAQSRELWVQREEDALTACMQDLGDPDALDTEILLWLACLGITGVLDNLKQRQRFAAAARLLAGRLGLQGRESVRAVQEKCFHFAVVEDCLTQCPTSEQSKAASRAEETDSNTVTDVMEWLDHSGLP